MQIKDDVALGLLRRKAILITDVENPSSELLIEFCADTDNPAEILRAAYDDKPNKSAAQREEIVCRIVNQLSDKLMSNFRNSDYNIRYGNPADLAAAEKAIIDKIFGVLEWHGSVTPSIMTSLFVYNYSNKKVDWSVVKDGSRVSGYSLAKIWPAIKHIPGHHRHVVDGDIIPTHQIFYAASRFYFRPEKKFENPYANKTGVAAQETLVKEILTPYVFNDAKWNGIDKECAALDTLDTFIKGKKTGKDTYPFGAGIDESRFKKWLLISYPDLVKITPRGFIADIKIGDIWQSGVNLKNPLVFKYLLNYSNKTVMNLLKTEKAPFGIYGYQTYAEFEKNHPVWAAGHIDVAMVSARDFIESIRHSDTLLRYTRNFGRFGDDKERVLMESVRRHPHRFYQMTELRDYPEILLEGVKRDGKLVRLLSSEQKANWEFYHTFAFASAKTYFPEFYRNEVYLNTPEDERKTLLIQAAKHTKNNGFYLSEAKISKGYQGFLNKLSASVNYYPEYEKKRKQVEEAKEIHLDIVKSFVSGLSVDEMAGIVNSFVGHLSAFLDELKHRGASADDIRTVCDAALTSGQKTRTVELLIAAQENTKTLKR